MKKSLYILAALSFITTHLQAQTEPAAGNWKTWFITSGKDYRLTAPPSYKNEIAAVLSQQQKSDVAGIRQIQYWNAGAPGYRWHEMMSKIWVVDTGRYGALANMLLGTAIYDATIAAWNTKYEYKRPRPFAADKRIKCLVPKPESPSYPCEYSVAAGMAVTIISRFYPALTDSVNRMAQEMMSSRITAGVAFPSDTRAGFDLGKRIAEKEIEYTKDFVSKEVWDGKTPEGPDYWRGKFAMLPMAGKNTTAVLTSSSQFRPGPPPDFAKEMEELKKFKSTFRSLSNAFYWANQNFWSEYLNKKIFENNLHLNPPQAARLYAITAVGLHDGFISCWDAKYTYWGIRPNQYDTTYRPPVLGTPPFPGYPSGHAAIGGVMCELFSYFFPEDKNFFLQKAKEGAESRFQAGIHFRTDNEVGLDMGRKVGAYIIQKLKEKGDGNALPVKK
jgi:membrane-associated phospholipid phosphatase